MRRIKTVQYAIIYGVMWAALGRLFYRNVWLSLIFIAVGLPFSLIRQKQTIIRGEKQVLEEQFKDSLLSLAASLRAGYSPENAWAEVHREMLLLHGEKSIIVKEIAGIRHKLEIRQPLEAILEEFGERSGLEDIRDFADVFKLAKRGGGDLVAVISSTAKTISDKFDVQREINTLLAAKKLEQRVMLVMPVAILLYMGVFNRGFLDVLYESAAGKVVMTVCLIAYIAAFILGERIVKIDI